VNSRPGDCGGTVAEKLPTDDRRGTAAARLLAYVDVDGLPYLRAVRTFSSVSHLTVGVRLNVK
jgi:hypothetical protein